MKLMIAIAALTLAFPACSQKQSTVETTSQSSQASSQPSAGPTQAAGPLARPNAVPNKTQVSFDFSDIAVTTSGPTLLRLGFTIHNGTSASLLCDASEFSAMLSNGDLLDADVSAADTCNPDTIDPHSTGQATMFFDLKSRYSGPVTLLMSANNKVIGRGLATVH